MCPGIQVGCQGWAVAAGQGCMGWGPGRWDCQGLRCAPLAAMQGECLPRVEDGGGRLVPAEPWTLALPSASPGSCGNLGPMAGAGGVFCLCAAESAWARGGSLAL